MPPSTSPAVCNAHFTHQIAALAYDLMAAIKLPDLSDDCQGWRVKTLMKKLVMLPGRLSQRVTKLPGILL